MSLRLSSRSRHLLNLLLAQAIWWLAVCGYTPIAALLLAGQFAISLTTLPRPFWHWLAPILISGWLLDTSLAALGWIHFRDSSTGLLPVWLLLLWISFALTVPVLLDWLPTARLRAAVFAIAGPLAYAGGVALGAATLNAPLAWSLASVTAWSLLPSLWSHGLRATHCAPIRP